jgi:hypothetical protein
MNNYQSIPIKDFRELSRKLVKDLKEKEKQIKADQLIPVKVRLDQLFIRREDQQ